MSWLDIIVRENNLFIEQVDKACLPIERQPCRYAIITCMDPRVNLQAIGEQTFKQTGASQSQTRIIRTLGAMVDDRSLLVGIHLAGIKEVAVVMHTDCGCCLAWTKANTIIENLQTSLAPQKLKCLESEIGKLTDTNLRRWLKAFQNPYTAIVIEVESIKAKTFVSNEIIVHGLVYNLETGKVDVVVNGYQ